MVGLKNAIINDVIENVRYRCKRFYNITLTQETKDKIGEFLGRQNLNNANVRVIFKSTTPNNYASCLVSNNGVLLKLAFGKNNRKEEYPNALFIHIIKQPPEKFRYFWKNRLWPTSLLPEVLKNISLSKEVKIEIFEDIEKWNEKRENEKSKTILIGQDSHNTDTTILVHINLPIGYIVLEENRIVLTLPNQKLKNGYAYYTFN